MTPSQPLSRRAFLAGAASVAAGVSASGGVRPAAAAGSLDAIEHIIVVMMENRSYDHLLGWLPGSDGRQAGLRYPDRDGTPTPTWHLAPDYQGCGFNDPDHSFEGARVEFDNGRCDGWLRAGQNDRFAIGYYTQSDLPFLGQAAPAFTTCDRYFSAIMSSTYPNRIYQHAGVTDRLGESFTLSTLPTIWDRLAAAGIDGRYYFSDVPILALWGFRYLLIGRFFSSFLSDCASGNLPAVAYVDPRFLGEEAGTSGDDHPHSDVRAGESFLARIYQAVTTSPAWPRTLLVLTFDEWGGFFDHVPPGQAPDVRPGLHRRGFRVPVVLVSPFARRRHVEHRVYDHTSVLRLIEDRFGLAPLSVRDANARSLATALDLSHPVLSAPSFSVPDVQSAACPPVAAPRSPRRGDEWLRLADLAVQHGWTIGT